MAHVEEIRCPDDLQRHRLLWNALHLQTRGATFLQSLDGVAAYWRVVGTGGGLRVLVVHEGGRPIGILPLVIVGEPTRAGRARVLTYPHHEWGAFFGPIGPNPTATLLLGLRSVASSRRAWDLVELRGVDRDGVDRGRSERAMAAAGLRPRVEAAGQAAVIAMEGSWEDYWAARPHEPRREIDDSLRRMERGGRTTFVRHRPEGRAHGEDDPRWDLFEDCAEVAGRSEGVAAAGGALRRRSIERFLREAHAAAAAAGALDMNLLYLGGRAVAFSYHYCWAGGIQRLWGGCDRRLADLRPDGALLRLVVEDSFSRGDRRFDLGGGVAGAAWPNARATRYRLTHFAPSPAGLVLRIGRAWRRTRLVGGCRGE